MDTAMRTDGLCDDCHRRPVYGDLLPLLRQLRGETGFKASQVDWYCEGCWWRHAHELPEGGQR